MGPPRLLAISPGKLALAAILLALADWGSRLAGDSLFPGAPLDELAHALTTLVAVWSLGPRVQQRLLVPALIASVVIDVDHIPGRLGVDWLTAGTQRPYTHSLLTILVIIALALACRRWRDPLLGVAAGLALHFWRDMGEPSSGVALLWPLSDHSFRACHWEYTAAMVACVLLGAVRLRSGAGHGWKAGLKLRCRRAD